MKIILHIGTHKTGTTSIQYFCMDNRTFLAEHGIHWPEEKLPKNSDQHSQLSQYIIDGEQEKFKQYIQRAVAGAKKDGQTTLFLSGEGFCRLTTEQVMALSRILSNHEVIILIGFRNIYDYVRSALTQRFERAENLESLQNIIKSYTKSLKYTATINRWEKAFGVKNITVFSYDQISKDLIPQFLTLLDIPIEQSNKFITKSTIRHKTSIDLSTQILLAASGYNYGIKKHKEAKKLYGQTFKNKQRLPLDPALLTTIVRNTNFQVDHKKLHGFQKSLLKPPQAISDSYDPLPYIENTGKFLTLLARHEKRVRIIHKVTKKIKLLIDTSNRYLRYVGIQIPTTNNGPTTAQQRPKNDDGL